MVCAPVLRPPEHLNRPVVPNGFHKFHERQKITRLLKLPLRDLGKIFLCWVVVHPHHPSLSPNSPTQASSNKPNKMSMVSFLPVAPPPPFPKRQERGQVLPATPNSGTGFNGSPATVFCLPATLQ